MKFLTKLLQLRFVPSSIDLALLLLRLWIGGSMLVLHGWTKLTGFSAMAPNFPDPLGVGSTSSLALTVVAEVAASVLLILGLFTRLAALLGGITMAVAFFLVKGGQLTGANNGELAFIFLAAYAALFLAGGGRHALDMKIAAASAPKSV
jgi:putative oxidoreductase